MYQKCMPKTMPKFDTQNGHTSWPRWGKGGSLLLRLILQKHVYAYHCLNHHSPQNMCMHMHIYIDHWILARGTPSRKRGGGYVHFVIYLCIHLLIYWYMYLFNFVYTARTEEDLLVARTRDNLPDARRLAYKKESRALCAPRSSVRRPGRCSHW